jgi:phosphate transport system substrate-binding protein
MRTAVGPVSHQIRRGVAAAQSAVAAVALFASTLALAQGIPPPSNQSADGVLRIAGNAQLAQIVARWKDGFEQKHPDIRLRIELKGSDVGMAGLYTAKADLALLGRDITESEEKAFEWVFRYKPSRVEIMTGSVDQAGKSPALVAFVHKDNPLQAISLDELGGAFAADGVLHLKPIRSWGDLGLGKSWKKRPIRLYSPYTESGTGIFMRAKIAQSKNAMHWDALTEFHEPVHLDHAADETGTRILDAVANDPNALAIAHRQPQVNGVRALPIRLPSGALIKADAQTIGDRTYPLARPVYAYHHRLGNGAMDPQVRKFIDYVLSPDGQAAIDKPSGYLPLSESLVLQSLKHLE